MANILIVDDKEYNLKAYKLALEDAGLGGNILTARNESEAQEIIEAQSIDVIITDLVMLTEQSGMEVLRLAKEKDPLLMVIIVTAYEAKLERYKAFELGAFDCITRATPGIKTEDEIIVKTKTALNFRELAIIQIENQKKLSFLKRYFDPKVFSVIDKNPELLDIQNRTLTIVFWDIRNFSSLCEILKAHPTLIAGFLREYFNTASKIIFKYHGVLDKFIGDGVMALFGALNGKDKEGHQDAINAVKAAIEMRECFDQVMKKWRDQYTALGPHVNFAQRIESKATKRQVLISASTKARISDHFELRKIDTINNIKNISGEFEIFEVITFKK